MGATVRRQVVGRLGRAGTSLRLPGLDAARRYERTWWRADVLAGVTVAAYLVPQVLAYAVIAGLPPVAGLWAVVPALTVYAVLGSSPRLSVGPESTTALLTAAAIAPLAGGDPQRYAALAAMLAIIVGGYCFIGWLAQLGFVSQLISRPVLIGYMAGVAVIMVAGQLGRLTGVDVDGDRVPQQVWSFLHHLDTVNGATIAVGSGVVVFLFVVQHYASSAPGPLLAVVGAAAVVAVFDLGDRGVELIGAIPAGLPRPGIPDVVWSDLRALLLPAAGVVIVGFTDNVLTARAFATDRDEALDANQELLALGAANVAAGFGRGFPVSSSGSRTAIAATMHARTQVYSLVVVATVVAVVFAGRGLLERFPQPALGGIVIYAASRLVNIAEFRRLARFRRSELAIAAVTTVGVLVFDILYGVLLAVGLSMVDLLARVARPHDAIQGRVPGLAGMHDIDDYPEAVEIPGLVVYRYDAPLFFANAEDFRRRALEAVASRPSPVHWFVLNVEANVEADLTALDAVEALRRQLADREIVFALARVKQDLLQQLQAFGLVDALGAEHLYPTLPTAVAAYERWRNAGAATQADES